jgi:hypothetical protein
MSTSRPYVYRTDAEPHTGSASSAAVDGSAVLGAVRDDIRQTLRTGWLDPALEAASASPAFFTAAWSAVRPNVGKSFLSLARTLRADAIDSVRATAETCDLAGRLRETLSEEEVRRVEESARAAHLAAPKVQIVVHAFHRVLRRERIPGTGREEPPIRRGIPEWQRWMSLQPALSEASRPILEDASSTLALPTPPVPLRLFARWPSALSALWDELRSFAAADAWRTTTGRLRRIALAGMGGLPHPMEVQWIALKSRGFSEQDRLRLLDVVAASDASMAAQTLVAAFAWKVLGAPEIGLES